MRKSAREKMCEMYSSRYYMPCAFTPDCSGILFYIDDEPSKGATLECSECAEGVKGPAALKALSNVPAGDRLS